LNHLGHQALGAEYDNEEIMDNPVSQLFSKYHNVRHLIGLVRARSRLEAADFDSGLGDSAWLL
jgi:hypothetical protein